MVAQHRKIKVVIVAEEIALFTFDFDFQKFLQML